MTSVANERETPYFRSSHVIGLPSCHFTPSLSVNFQTWPLLLEVPVSVARSGTGVVPFLRSVVIGYVTRLRYASRDRLARSRPMYVRCGSRCSAGLNVR
jgi:hypothetical protein